MRLLRLAFFAGVIVAGGCSTGPRHTPHEALVHFALIGDVPYSDYDLKVSFPNMIEEINRAHVAFTVHDGDIKSGSSPCSMEVLNEIYGEFQKFESPLVYLFGDNEWTDCGRSPTNTVSPEQWLERLREKFTAGNESLGKRRLTLRRQSDHPKFGKFRENVRWEMGGVLFVGLNVPGDANNFGFSEFSERNQANLAWIKEGFDLAKIEETRALMIIMQANPHFDLNASNRLRLGFNDLIALLQKEAPLLKKPVVLVHGDSHYFRIDKPLLGVNSKRRIENFTRVETFGYPDVHWVEATIDPSEPEVFVFRQRIIRRNLVDHSKSR